MVTPDPNWKHADFYAELGVEKTADQNTIKKAYRRLARLHHPDTNPDSPELHEKFKAVAKAYEVLGDQEKRRAYDALRRSVLGSAHTMGFGVSAPLFEDLNVESVDLNGLFGDFTGSTGFTSGTKSKVGFSTPGPTVRDTAHLTFNEAVLGGELSLKTTAGKTYEVTLPPLLEDKEVILVPGMGGKGKNGGANGDLHLTVRVGGHPWFSRRGADLLLTLPVTYDELSLGATVEVPTYPEGKVKLRIPPLTPNGRTLRVNGKGVEGPRGVLGDLLVTVRVEVPKELSPEAEEALEAYRLATTQHQPRVAYFE